MEELPQAVRRLLWDVDPASVRLPEHNRWLIARIMNWGDEEACRWMLARFTPEEVRNALCTSRSLSTGTARAWAQRLRVPEEEVPVLRREPWHLWLVGE